MLGASSRAGGHGEPCVVTRRALLGRCQGWTLARGTRQDTLLRGVHSDKVLSWWLREKRETQAHLEGKDLQQWFVSKLHPVFRETAHQFHNLQSHWILWHQLSLRFAFLRENWGVWEFCYSNSWPTPASYLNLDPFPVFSVTSGTTESANRNNFWTPAQAITWQFILWSYARSVMLSSCQHVPEVMLMMPVRKSLFFHGVGAKTTATECMFRTFQDGCPGGVVCCSMPGWCREAGVA